MDIILDNLKPICRLDNLKPICRLDNLKPICRLDNLKPICRLCNSSMSIMNMDEFIKFYNYTIINTNTFI